MFAAVHESVSPCSFSIVAGRAPLALPFIALVAYASDVWLAKLWSHFGLTSETIWRARYIEKEIDCIRNCNI